jgi:hypothetical protein
LDNFNNSLSNYYTKDAIDSVIDQKFNFSSPGGDANRWFNIGYAQILTSNRGTSPQLNMEIYLSNLIGSCYTI